MEFKKKTLIWEDNNEPPKDYIWAKKDGKFYEYSYTTRSWIESKLIKAEESGGSDGGGGSADINTILDNISIKEDLLTKLQAVDYTNQELGDILTDLTFDDVFNDYNDFIKSWLYREEPPVITIIRFTRRISVTKGSDSLEVDIPDEDYISYHVSIIDEDNDIKIYAIKQDSRPA